jgi:hypothetical protein
MKLCWDNIDTLSLSLRGNFLVNNKTRYLCECTICEELYISSRNNNSYCSNDCKKEYFEGDGNPFYGREHTEEFKNNHSNIMKGMLSGYKNGNYNRKLSKEHRRKISSSKLGIGFKGGCEYVYYDSYSHKLEPYEETRRCPDDENILEVRCYHNKCNKWFIPSRSLVDNRVQTIKGNKENRLFYCSDECRQKCYVFGKHITTLINNNVDIKIRKDQPDLRNIVFERDNWTCQKCNSSKELHCHHFEGIEINPIESADIDNCITLCKKCHKEVHKQDGCKYNQLRCK